MEVADAQPAGRRTPAARSSSSCSRATPSTASPAPKNGYCELQSLASEYGIDRVPFEGKTRHHYTDFSSPSIIREPDKCILCGRCVRICEEIQGVAAIDFTRRGFDTMVLPPFEMDLSETTCVNCGQCTLACPTGALHEVRAVEKVIQVLQEGKKYVVAQAAPAIRVSLGDFFGLAPGANVTGKVAAAPAAHGLPPGLRHRLRRRPHDHGGGHGAGAQDHGGRRSFRCSPPAALPGSSSPSTTTPSCSRTSPPARARRR